MDVTVVIATFGDPSWQGLAATAAASVPEDVPVVKVHAFDLAQARNSGLERVRSESVCFLDADDELEPGYFDHIAAARGDLRVPKVRYVYGKSERQPWMPQVAGHDHACTADCLSFGNWLVIGTVAPTELIRQVGGFRDFDIYEDWDLWARCWQAGATITPVPEAIYRAHVRPGSRNRGRTSRAKRAAHQAIAEANGLPVP